MKHVFRTFLIIVVFLSLTLFFYICPSEKGKVGTVEPLRTAANDFKLMMDNLDRILKAGNLTAAKDTLKLLAAKFTQIKAVEIPERLVESTEKIKSRIDALSTSMNELSMALLQPELTQIDSTVLKGFDAVRTNFAKLGSLLRVKIPELITFHDVLYKVWHDYYPNDAIDSIKAIVPEFKEEAATLDKIQWPDVLNDQIETLKEQVKALQIAVDKLEAACQGEDTEAIKKATADVHENYRAINMML